MLTKQPASDNIEKQEVIDASTCRVGKTSTATVHGQQSFCFLKWMRRMLQMGRSNFLDPRKIRALKSALDRNDKKLGCRRQNVGRAISAEIQCQLLHSRTRSVLLKTYNERMTLTFTATQGHRRGHLRSLALLTCLTGEGCDLHHLISSTFRPSACQLSVVAPFRLTVLRSGTAYQMTSPPLCPCQPSGAI